MMRLLLLSVAALFLSAAEVNLETLLKDVEKRYNSAQSIEVPFEQVYTIQGRPRRPESGQLYLKKPGKMRWQYKDPAGKLFISDGKHSWFYSPAMNRVEKTPLKSTDDMRAPLAFLLGKLDFSRDFRQFRVSPEGGNTRVIALPKSKNAPYSHVDFTIAPDHRILRLSIESVDGTTVEYKFGAEKVNPPVDAKLFQFQMPPGVEFVETAATR